MILEYGASNYHSFNEGFSISFRLNKSCPPEISQGKEVASALCVKGANGSGKTTTLKALSFLNFFCSQSFNLLEPQGLIPFDPFAGSDTPTSFYIEFKINEVEYRYELTVTPSHILEEKLSRKVKSWKTIVERKDDILVECSIDFNDLQIIKLRSNASFISTANHYEEIESISSIYNFFKNILTNVELIGKRQTLPSFNQVNELYKNNPDTFNFVKDIISRFDLGIKDIEIDVRFDENGDELYQPYFIHEANGNDFRLPFNKESSGTKSLYKQLIQYFSVLKIKGVLIMDEFDINLHPDILPHLVELFTQEKYNPLDSQLLFTTHSSNILDAMGKYRSVLVNKDDNQSFLYRLDEIPSDNNYKSINDAMKSLITEPTFICRDMWSSGKMQNIIIQA